MKKAEYYARFKLGDCVLRFTLGCGYTENIRRVIETFEKSIRVITRKDHNINGPGLEERQRGVEFHYLLRSLCMVVSALLSEVLVEMRVTGACRRVPNTAQHVSLQGNTPASNTKRLLKDI